MKKQPKVSIVVPIYGVEKYLNQCVDSILAQTLTDIEIILVDDGSPDKCPQIVDEYAKRDKRVVAVHQPNGGYGVAMNHGIELARGEYIGIVESDDWIDKNMYKELYDIASKNDVDIVKSSFFMHITIPNKKFHTDKMKWLYNPPTNIFKIKDYPVFLSHHPSIWSCLYKRNFLNKHKIKFIEAPGAGWTDNPFQVQTMCLAEKIKYTDEAYYHYRIVVENSVNNYNVPLSRLEDIFDFVKKEHITDKNILHHLTKRALNYMDTVLRLKTIQNKQNCYNRIKTICSWLDKDIIKNSDYITSEEKILYKTCVKSPAFWRFCVKSRYYRSKLIKLHLNRHEILFKLLGLNLICIKLLKEEQ